LAFVYFVYFVVYLLCIYFEKVSISIRSAAFWAGDWADTRNHMLFYFTLLRQ